MEKDYEIVVEYLENNKFEIDANHEISCLISCDSCYFGSILNNACYLHSAKFCKLLIKDYPELFL